jgi:hypothetical protein
VLERRLSDQFQRADTHPKVSKATPQKRKTIVFDILLSGILNWVIVGQPGTILEASIQ